MGAGRGRGGERQPTSAVAPANREKRQQRRSAEAGVWRCILLLLQRLK